MKTKTIYSMIVRTVGVGREKGKTGKRNENLQKRKHKKIGEDNEEEKKQW